MEVKTYRILKICLEFFPYIKGNVQDVDGPNIDSELLIVQC